MVDNLSKDLGKHEAEITQLKEDMKAVKADVHKILLLLSEAKGGWRAMIGVATFSSMIGAVVIKIITWMIEK